MRTVQYAKEEDYSHGHVIAAIVKSAPHVPYKEEYLY